MKTPAVRYATASDGVRIAYSVLGTGDPLLYCRCPTGPTFTTVLTTAELDPWFGALADRFQLISFDFRGGGLSGRGDRGFGFETLAEDMLAVLDDAGMPSANIMTELMATAPAIRLATDLPERVRRLVMWHPMIAQAQRSADPQLTARWNRFFATAQDDWEMFCVRLLKDSYDVPDRAIRRIAEDWARKVDVRDFSEAWDPRGTGTAEPILESLSTPTLVLQRALDGYYRLTLDGAELAAKMPQGELRLVPGRDNFPYADHPAQIVAEVEQFLGLSGGETGDSPARAATKRRGRVETSGHDVDPRLLSARELDVVRLVARGLRNPEIAAQLGVARSTVSSHVHNSLVKTNLSNRAELTGYAYRTGLADRARSGTD